MNTTDKDREEAQKLFGRITNRHEGVDILHLLSGELARVRAEARAAYTDTRPAPAGGYRGKN